MSYRGLNAANGRAIDDMAHIRQSIADILATPRGSRVMRRSYGSLLPGLIDQPMNGATLLRFSAAAYAALLQWEPRVRVTRIAFAPDASQPGRLVVDLQLVRADVPGPSTNVAIPLSLA